MLLSHMPLPKFDITKDKNICDCVKDNATMTNSTRINLTEKIKFVLGRVENIMVNGENAGFKSVMEVHSFMHGCLPYLNTMPNNCT